MRNMGNAAQYFMFFKWKVRFWPVYVFWAKNKGTILFTSHFYLG